MIRLIQVAKNKSSFSAVSLTRGEKLCLVLCTGLYVLPVWALSYFPSQDGSVHLMNAMMLSQYHGPAGDLWRQYYSTNTPFVPTWLGHLALAGLLRLMSPELAEKVFLSGYIVGMILSFYYCLRSLNPSSGFCLIFIFPFLYNDLFHMGFYSFSYSFIVYFVLIGYFLRHRYRFGVAKTSILFLLSGLVYLLHPISFVMATLFVGPICLLDTFRPRSFFWNSQAEELEDPLKRMIPVVAMLPFLILLVFFASGQSIKAYHFPDCVYQLRRLLTLAFLVSFDYKEYVWTILLDFLVLLLLIRGGTSLFSKTNKYSNIIPIIILYALMYVFVPDSGVFGGGYISYRLGLFTTLLLALWLSANWHLWRFRSGLQICLYAISVGVLATHFVRYVQLNDYLNEYVSAGHYVRPNTTLIPLSFSDRVKSADGKELSIKVRPFHAAGYIAVDRHVVDLSNYESRMGYFPLVFRPHLNPYVHLGNLDTIPPIMHSLEYPADSGGRVDYILVQGRSSAPRDEKLESIMKKIESRFQLIHVSQPRGLVELWRNKDFAKASEIGR